MKNLINLAEFEVAAQSRLTPPLRDYFAGGAGDEITLRDNAAAYERLRLHYRVLRGVTECSMAATVLGDRISMPVLIAPLALQGAVHREGELATARAAAHAGTVMILSTWSTRPVEEVVACAGGPVWFQLYLHRDRAVTREMVQRAEAAGCRALVLTVDTPVVGARERDLRSGFQLPPGLTLSHLASAPVSTGDAGKLPQHAQAVFESAIGWQDLEWLCALTRLPVVVKGVVRADDAESCIEHGARAIIVSNHGGRQLDTAPATIDVLAEIVALVGNETEVYVDGGIRRGTDVVKALALGARAVLLGRPIIWGLTLNGEEGVTRVLELLHAELEQAMMLCGCRSIEEIDHGLVRPAPR